tara:strand:- start:417 stop:938 length:522 start_codon:yes stop_codon:yes gene_type:complete
MSIKPVVNMRSSCIIELVEIYKFSEFEVSKCIGNSPKVVRKHYMNQMQADHRKEAETQKIEDEGSNSGDKSGDNRPAPQRSAACRTDTVIMPIEDYERLIKERETLRNQRLNVLLDAVEDRSVPPQSKSAKTKQVHPTGFEPVTSCSVGGNLKALIFRYTFAVSLANTSVSLV